MILVFAKGGALIYMEFRDIYSFPRVTFFIFFLPEYIILTVMHFKVEDYNSIIQYIFFASCTKIIIRPALFHIKCSKVALMVI